MECERYDHDRYQEGREGAPCKISLKEGVTCKFLYEKQVGCN